ncbi:MAG: hypothetical protein FWG65_13125 [Turicibacter sp.]|nr:hypothetical protein [Turicibacter sp.]
MNDRLGEKRTIDLDTIMRLFKDLTRKQQIYICGFLQKISFDLPASTKKETQP